MAAAIMIDLNVAQKFGGEMQVLDRLESRADHATMGLIITFLLVLRIILRFRYGAPSLPKSMSKWQIIAAQVGHYGLYILMGALVMTGIISATYASDPILVFNSYDLAFANHNDNAFRTVRGIHEFCTNAIIALIFIHILAAIYHHFILKDKTTLNMSKFWTTKHISKQN
jgi:cytochrome b561